MDHYWETSSGSKFIGSSSVKLHPIPVHSWITIYWETSPGSKFIGRQRIPAFCMLWDFLRVKLALSESEPLRGERKEYVKLEGLSQDQNVYQVENEHYSIHYLSIALKALI